MPTIIYGVLGEGFGHATRSRVILEHLAKKHTVHIVAGGKAYQYLSKHFKNIYHVEFLQINYKNNAVNVPHLIFANTAKVHRLIMSFNKVLKLVKSVTSPVLITDCEAMTAYAALFLRRPLITVDNQHIFDNPLLKFPPKYFYEYTQAHMVVKMMVPAALQHIITTFFYPAVPAAAMPTHHYVGPILRREIMECTPAKENYILVYQTSKSNTALLGVLEKCREQFVVYGFDKEVRRKNVTQKFFNEDRFLNDLANCKAVITNGGHSLISEALYLKKPVLSIPVKKQFEQRLNALYLKKAGYGDIAEQVSVLAIKKFVSHLPDYQQNFKEPIRVGNAQACALLDKYISLYAKN